ncbi:type II toxin-antitoxin system RelE/ParE family toxin [Ohtaekwangia koreensis]|uniref:Plasmid stabilization system protein ParE n=1 Tax=Ohtaekwangia koreensis TaxID=688867 RepID=A0A1T5KDH6_9BACT|nr:type II toxin-antitoxin system RelE/ParE family toxin [Ohtaekwangia koreensis]SKC61782.1 Plasmid stabilization system protein ParE [Ohtaekwangia koreensis]
MKVLYRVVVSETAEKSLHEIVLFIKKDSPSAAARVRKELLKLIKSLDAFPEGFSRESFLFGKGDNYRSVTKWHYKIVYKILDKDVLILDIIHTSQHPDSGTEKN